jgi:hypothetical protein
MSKYVECSADVLTDHMPQRPPVARTAGKLTAAVAGTTGRLASAVTGVMHLVPR